MQRSKGKHRRVKEQFPKTKRRLFKLVCVLLPIGGLLALELVLRAVGWGGHPPILRQLSETSEGRLMVADPDGTKDYFFANHRSTGGNAQFVFQMPKPTGTVRVFLYGGSAIKGFPQPRHLTPSSFLQVMLADIWPDREIEVINFGTTAVASFPVCDMLEQTVSSEPDLVVIYTGHNEFYGAYGTASSHRAGSQPWMQRLHRSFRALAVVQALQAFGARSNTDRPADLMRVMVGQEHIGPEDWRREAAARNLGHNLRRMIRRCQKDGIPVLVCTLPSNERDLAPIGRDDVPITDGEMSRTGGGEELEAELLKCLGTHPTFARDHYKLGRLLYAQGRHEEARTHFVQARDLDTMPWRATTLSLQAIRNVVSEEDAVLCDVEALFRERSPGGCIGWELMDDHVHPTEQGQALIAEAIVRSMANAQGDLGVQDGDLDRLRSWKDYASQLGASDFDRYSVTRWMHKIFSIQFMRASNPEALQRFDDLASGIEQEQPEDIRRVLQNWDSKTPINVLVAGRFIQQGRFQDALPLLRSAQHGTTHCSAAYLEAVYNELGCLAQIQGTLAEDDQQRALKAIERGKFLLRLGAPEPWIFQRTIGRLYLLREEYAEAIPYLLAAHSQLKGRDRIVDDRVLVRAYLEIGDPVSARAIANSGLRQSGRFSQVYLDLLAGIPEPETNGAHILQPDAAAGVGKPESPSD